MTKTRQYVVRINRDPGSDWGASVPDLPGCVATGKTIDTALRRIERAIELHIRGLREDGLPVPRPRERVVRPRRRPKMVDFFATVAVAALTPISPPVVKGKDVPQSVVGFSERATVKDDLGITVVPFIAVFVSRAG
jgi:predicted RNase H-like HicB family nuclease